MLHGTSTIVKLSICFVLLANLVVSDDASCDTPQPRRVFERCLFIGDSITLHGPSKTLSWDGNWGMAASSKEKDFVHQVYAYLCGIQKGNEPKLLISGRDTGQAGRVDNALKVLSELTAVKADFIVVQLGENEKSHEVTRDNFLAKYDKLVAALRESSPKALIICTGVWTPKGANPRKVLKEDFIKEVSAKYGCVYVDIASVGHRPENTAWSEKKYSHWGVGWHPGDKGMKGYAEEIIAAIKPHIFTQPIKVAKKLTGIVPEPQNVYTFTDKRDGFVFGRNTQIVIRKQAGDLERKAAEIIRDDLKQLFNLDIKITQREFSGQKPALIITNDLSSFDRNWQERPFKVKELSAKGSESYQLSSYAAGIFIESVSPPGVFYGAQTLRQIIDGKKSAPPVLIADWPDQELRINYLGYPSQPEWIVKKMARLKVNACIVESKWFAGGNWWYNPTGKNYQEATRFIKLCKEYNIEMIPLVQGLGWAYGVADINPACCEGLWVRDEKIILSRSTPVRLKHANVLFTKASPIVITSLDKKTTYTENKDYKVIPGVTRRKFDTKNKPWKIQLTKTSRIKDSQQVLTSYNYMTYTSHQSPYCPSEPDTYKIVDSTLANVVKLYKPRYIHIGHDEVIHKRRDSRCLQSGKSLEELMGQDIQHWYKKIKSLDPNIEIMIWDDLLRKEKYKGEIIKWVPTDVIICPWYYHIRPNSPQAIDGRMSWFVKDTGRPTIGTTSGYWPGNIMAWRDSVEKYSRYSNNLGLMFSHWGESQMLWSSLPFAAEYMWSRAKPNRSGFSQYDLINTCFKKRNLNVTESIAWQKAALEKILNSWILSNIEIDKQARAFRKTIRTPAVKIAMNSEKLFQRNDSGLGNVPEMMLPQAMRILSYMEAVGIYVNAWRSHLNTDYSQADKLLNKLASFAEKQNLPRQATIRDSAKAYKSQRKFPDSVTLFGLELKAPSKEPLHGILCPLEGVEDLKKKQDGFVEYDFGHGITFGRVDIAGKPGNYEILISKDAAEFTTVAMVTLENKKVTASWNPVSARKLQIRSKDVDPSSVKADIFVSKPNLEYTVQHNKTASTAWKTTEFWTNIKKAEVFVLQNLQAAQWQTTAAAVYDNDKLYVRFECRFPPEKDITDTNKSLQVYERGECVQFFVRPDNTKPAFHQVIIGADGDSLTNVHMGNQSSPKTIIDKAITISDGLWSVSFSVPLEWFGKSPKGDTWKMNFCRTGGKGSQNSSWAMLPDASFWFLQPESFVPVHFN